MELLSLKQRFGIIGNSPGINYALEVATRVAPTNLTVLITGESGVGKEVFSHIIHQNSTRKHNPFIAVNCGAIPEGTIDSELFGHEKGAFTGASDNRKGYFETVNGGTIFLDEIGEMPLGTQARLLRVLESGEFIKVGSSKVLKTDVRVVAATNVTLGDLIERNRFREDLYYRLNTVPISIPPLRERREDIYLLFRKFAVDFAEKYRMPGVMLDNEAKAILDNYPWPGNIRELKNIAEQISVLAEDKIVTADDLRGFLPKIGKRNLPVHVPSGGTSGDHLNERELLYKVLFEMRKDLNDLKQFVWQISENGSTSGIQMPTSLIPSGESASGFQSAAGESQERQYSERFVDTNSAHKPATSPGHAESSTSYVVNSDETVEANSVEESLSLKEMEKEMIQLALKKHKGKRKDAALDLDISERTLYRKIKEYDIVE